MIRVKNHHTPPTIRPDKDLRERERESRRANKFPQIDQLGETLTISTDVSKAIMAYKKTQDLEELTKQAFKEQPDKSVS